MFIEKVKSTIEKYNMLKHGNAVFVGLSGGADSVAMLYALSELAEEHGIAVNAVHANHQLRGEESERDERFCIELCRKLNIPLDVKRVDVNQYAKENKCSIEEAARVLRYNAFQEVSDCQLSIATAHTANDNIETIIYNLTRGTGLKGLAGIPPVRGNIIRPLIECSRQDVLEYLNGRNFVTDSSNLSDKYARNKIRHYVIPVLEELNSGVISNVAKFSEIIRKENDYLEAIAEQHINDDLRTVDEVIRRRVIISLLKQHLPKMTAEDVFTAERLVMSDNGKRFNIRKNLYMRAENGRLFLSYAEPATPKTAFQPVKAVLGENPFLCDRIVKISLNCHKNDKVHENLTNNVLDYDKIKGVLFLRTRIEGDKYVRANRDFHSSLKKLFNAEVDENERDGIAVLCDDLGIIWVERFGCADRVKIDGNTERIMEIEVT